MYESGELGYNKYAVGLGRDNEYEVARILSEAVFDASAAHGAGYQAYMGFLAADAIQARATESDDSKLASQAADAREEAERFRTIASTNAGNCLEKYGGVIQLSTTAIGQFAEAIDDHSTGAQLKIDAHNHSDAIIGTTSVINEAANALPVANGEQLLAAANLIGEAVATIELQKQQALGIASLAQDYINTQ